MCAIDCVLVGLDWVEPRMQFILHVTYSCISHAYVLYFLIYLLYLNCVGAFLIVSFSLPLFLFTLVVSMAPKRKSAPSRNLLRSETSSSSSNPTPSHIRFHDEDARKAFSENFSRRGIHSERQVILAYPLKVLFLSIISTHWGEGLVHIRVTGNPISSTLNGLEL